MEIVQIINDGHLSHNQQWGGFLSLDGEINNGHIVQDVVLAPFESNPVAPQYYIVDADGSIVPIVGGNNFTILAPEPDDEVPAHKLDHMYAKKPREPGTEVVKPARRRSKKKELLKSHYYVQEMMQEAPPKINIIRGRHAMTLPVHNRPKILTSPHKMFSTFSSTNMFFNSTHTGTTSAPSNFRSMAKMKIDEVPKAVVFEDYEDYNAPSPGAVVTVCDGVELDPVIVSTRSMKPKKLSYASCGQSPSSIENRNSSLDSIGEPEDDAELFLDFPMEGEEEVDPSIDVDFNEISMNSGNGIDTILRGTPVAYFNSSSEPEDNEYIGTSIDSPNQIEPDKCSPSHESQSVLGDTCYQSTNKVVKKRGRPAKTHSDSLYDDPSDFIDCVDSSGSSPRGKSKNREGSFVNQDIKVFAPTRRSTRPIKAPSRLDDIEDISLSKRKRR